MSAHRITLLSSSPEPESPVTLATVKAHLRVTNDEEDDLILHYLDSAIAWAEDEANRAIQSRQYLVVRDEFPVGGWMLPLGRVQSIDLVQYIDNDGVTQSWDTSPQEYQLDNASDFQSRLRPKSGFSWPTTGSYLSAARVSLTAGWTAQQIPYTVKQALLMKVASMYDFRAPGDGDADAIEEAAKRLLSGWRLPVFSA